MKKLLCGLLCLLMLLGCASAEGYWYAAKGDNGLWGHIDEMGSYWQGRFAACALVERV